MGLLDDAIREHLELKRRHGADPEEVTRQEREALGAPVRGEFAKPDEGERDDVEAAVPDEPSDPEEPAAVAAEPEPDLVPEFEPAAEPEPAPGTEEDPWFVEDLADEKPEPEQDPAATVEHDTLRPDEDKAEDVLEETPEFLQETPEHDRLWFEQKPPRDFDWDK
jgi:hypothetical protein